MTTIFETAYAKLNLTLDVLGKREDGYHDLCSVMQTVSLCDDVEVDIGTGDVWTLNCSRPGIPEDSRNLAWRGAETFFSATKLDPEGLSIRIHKRIPSGAGMGGGSADAAAVLRALNRHFGYPLSPEELAELGARVGSDVPFCVMQGAAMAEGRGERLRPIPGLPPCSIVISKPEFSVSTPELYRVIDGVTITLRPDNPGMEAALRTGDLTAAAGHIYNVFDPVVSSRHPEVETIKAVCRSCGALGAQMTGSGSAVFAVMPDSAGAARAIEQLQESFPETFLAYPI